MGHQRLNSMIIISIQTSEDNNDLLALEALFSDYIQFKENNILDLLIRLIYSANIDNDQNSLLLKNWL